MRELLFENITVRESNRGLALQARDGGNITGVTFRNITIVGTRLWPVTWWGAGEAIYISSAPRTASTPSNHISNITFEDIRVQASQNAAVILSGRAPGAVLVNIMLRRVSAVIDRLPGWNYSSPATPPNIEYDPSSVFSPSRVNLTGWMPGVYVEGVLGLVLEDVSIVFNNARQQAYWGSECFNLTAAGHPVATSNLSCVPPARPAGLMLAAAD